MKLATRCAALAALLLTLPSTQAQDVKPGEWQYSIKTEIPGLPFPMPPMSFKNCVTEKDIAEGKAYQQDPKNKDCKTENLKQTSSSASYDIVCTGKNPMTGHYDVTFSDTAMSGKGTINVQGKVVNNSMEGKRLGDCK